MVVVEAEVIDSTHLRLSKAIAVGRGRRLIVSLAESTERDVERWQWITGGMAGLEAAYGDTEPKYTPAMVKESNSAYGT